MRFTLLTALTAMLLSAPAVMAQVQTHITTVTPDTGKAGDEISAAGEEIGAGKVEKLYLTNGKDDVEVKMSEQNDTMIKFKIPADMKPGRWTLMVLTKGANPSLMEEPVKVTVE